MDRSRLPIVPEPLAKELAVDRRDVNLNTVQPSVVDPPEGAPNVLVVLIDDMGFGASSAFGGPCRMPVAEKLAGRGLRFNRFHTAAVCAPTRAALLTGRNQHTAEMGGIPETATPQRGYTSVRPLSVASLPRVLAGNGYSTGAFGKMHGTPSWELSPTGPFDRWPTGEGFQHFYGFIGAESDQFSPGDLVSGTTRIDPPATPDEGYHLSEDLAANAVQWIDSVHTVEPERPWFCYLSFGATHAPIQVPAAWLDNYRGEFDGGWDVERERTLQRQKDLGVVPADTVLGPWPAEAPHWDELDDTQRKASSRLMELYAAFAEHTDAQVGRVTDYLAETGQLENTLVLYILGDNGPAAEGGIEGTWNEMYMVNGGEVSAQDILDHYDDLGGPKSSVQYPAGWALAMATPYQWAKQVASHYGGTRNGMIAHWPAEIADAGGHRTQWHHVVDIVPTVLEAAGIPMPSSVDGIEQKPLEGVSFLYALHDEQADERHHTQYFEAVGNRGIYHRGWTAVAKHRMPWNGEAGIKPFDEDTWELYDTTTDWSQARDLADDHPKTLRRLQELFMIEASRHDVFPLDDRWYERFNATLAGRRDLMSERREVTLSRSTPRLREDVAPNLKNVSHQVRAHVADAAQASGVIVAQGGRFAGWSLWMDSGRPRYSYNFCGVERVTVAADQPVPEGDVDIVLRFEYEGGGAGKGARFNLLVNDRIVATGGIDRTVSFIFSEDETLDVGVDRGTPVVEDYGAFPTNSFTGNIQQVTLTVTGERHNPSAAQSAAAALITH